MEIRVLTLNDFRNASVSKIEFCDGVNVICGSNGAGKTNILEAIFYFAAGKSFRNCKDRELIRFGCEKARIEMSFDSRSVNKKMSAVLSKNARRAIRIGNSSPLTLSNYIGQFRAVIFTPDHLNLVKGSPENRRKFMDLAICQSFPRYASSLSEYNRILMQKQALLKRKNPQKELLEIYNERLSSLAAIITVNRRKYIAKLEQEAKKFLFDMSEGREELQISYQSHAGEAETQEEIREKYKAIFSEKMDYEIERYMTYYGSHRDDFVISVNKKSARHYASQGQQRSIVLSLKLAEGELSAQLTGEYPVFLLDDILSELDKDRKNYILSRLPNRQVIITGCESEVFESDGFGKRIFVQNGIITEL